MKMLILWSSGREGLSLYLGVGQRQFRVSVEGQSLLLVYDVLTRFIYSRAGTGLRCTEHVMNIATELEDYERTVTVKSVTSRSCNRRLPVTDA